MEGTARLLFWRQCQGFFFRSQTSRQVVVFETRKVLSDAKRHQAPANEQPAGDRLGMMFSNLPGPTHHFRSDLGVGEMTVGLAF